MGRRRRGIGVPGTGLTCVHYLIVRDKRKISTKIMTLKAIGKEIEKLEEKGFKRSASPCVVKNKQYNIGFKCR